MTSYPMEPSAESLDEMCPDCFRWAMKRYTVKVLADSGVYERSLTACVACGADRKLAQR